MIALFVNEVDYSDIPADIVKAAKKCIMDWIAVGFAGSATPLSKQVFQMPAKDTEESTILVYPLRKGNHLLASFFNAFFSHILELDDVHRGSTYHPGSPTISAAFSQGERLRVSGKKLIESIVLGYEVSIRVGECLGGSHYRYWHTTGTCGVFGAAVAGAKMLGLDAEKITFAIGNAGTQSSGLWQFVLDGAMTKPLHPAKAAMDGLIAADLAARGFSGPHRIFEGEKGLCRATTDGSFSLEKLVSGLGETWKIGEVSFKPYPCCRHIHSSIDAAIKAYCKSALSVDSIAKINVYTYKVAIETAGTRFPKSIEEARFSIPYCVSVAILCGKVSLAHFSQQFLEDKNVKRVLEKVNLIEDEKYTKLYPSKWVSRVEIVSDDGATYDSIVEFPKGDPENPLLDKEMESKFEELLLPILPEKHVRRLKDKIWNLEEIDDISSFFKEG